MDVNLYGEKSVPEEFRTDVYMVEAGYRSTCAISNRDWSLECWGDFKMSYKVNVEGLEGGRFVDVDKVIEDEEEQMKVCRIKQIIIGLEFVAVLQNDGTFQ